MTKRKIVVETDNSEWKAPKKRKPRKPMSEEQRVAAAKRLEKAREARAAKNPDFGYTETLYSISRVWRLGTMGLHAKFGINCGYPNKTKSHLT